MDPKAAIDAVLQTGPKAFTIARWACLQRINSKLVDPEKGDEDLVPTVYVMFADVDDLRANLDDLRSAAYKWADKVPLADFPGMLEMAAKSVNDALYMIPESASKKKPESATA